MKLSNNEVTLTGFIGRDAEAKQTKTGKKFTRVSMSTNEGWKNKETGEWTNETTWHNLCAWGTIAEPMASLTKGTFVQVRGSIRHYQLPEQNGKPARTATEIVVNAFTKLDRNRREALQETAA